MDEIRSAYKAFLDGPGGKDLLEWLLNKEITAQMNGRRATSVDEKAFAMVELNIAYDFRSHLAEMSKPIKIAVSKNILASKTSEGR